MKILFYATFPTETNGYARIANVITNYLAAKNHDIYYFGITSSGSVLVPRNIHPSIKIIDVAQNSPSNNPYGDDLIAEVVGSIYPDIVFIYNDILVCSRMLYQLERIKKSFLTYVYIDLVYPFENIQILHSINQFTDKFFVFSSCWKNNMTKMGIPASKIFVLRHGLDTQKVYKIEQRIARKKLNISEDFFIVLNINRNTHRKAIDLTIASFLRFLKKNNCDTNIKLFLTSRQEPTSYDFKEIFRIECLQLDLDYEKILNNHTLFSANNVMSDEMVNLVYNISDVGINTCLGEGFGLCSVEHAAVGKPQIVPGVGSFRDIFNSGHCKLIEPVAKLYCPTALDTVGGYIEICRSEDFADALDEYYHSKEIRENDGKYFEELIPIAYNWKDILDEFNVNHIEYEM